MQHPQGSSQSAVNASRGCDALFWFTWAPGTQEVCIYVSIYIHIHRPANTPDSFTQTLGIKVTSSRLNSKRFIDQVTFPAPNSPVFKSWQTSPFFQSIHSNSKGTVGHIQQALCKQRLKVGSLSHIKLFHWGVTPHGFYC